MDKKFMKRAIELAVEGMENNEGGPFGCVIVKDGTVLAEGCNRVTSKNDPTAHAEMVAIRNACKKIGEFQLTGCDIYTSCEPCPMCLGAIYWARPATVYYAATREDAAAAGFDDEFIYREIRLSPERRSIPMKNLERQPALSAFASWNRKTDKIRY